MINHPSAVTCGIQSPSFVDGLVMGHGGRNRSSPPRGVAGVGGVRAQSRDLVGEAEAEDVGVEVEPDGRGLVVPPGRRRPDRHVSGGPDRGLVGERPPDLVDAQAEVVGDVLGVLPGLVVLLDNGSADTPDGRTAMAELRVDLHR